jgi:hypothetical protein
VLLFSDRGLVKPLKAFAIEEFKSQYSTLLDGTLLEPDIPLEICVNHMISSMITLVRWWLENDMCYSPEEMGRYAYRLIIRPVSELILQGLPE